MNLWEDGANFRAWRVRLRIVIDLVSIVLWLRQAHVCDIDVARESAPKLRMASRAGNATAACVFVLLNDESFAERAGEPLECLRAGGVAVYGERLAIFGDSCDIHRGRILG